MGNVFVRLMPGLPVAVKGMTVRDEEGDYNVYINPAHAHAENLKAFDHELRHIRNGDLDKEGSIEQMEGDAYGSKETR